jgi:hypothetical protein
LLGIVPGAPAQWSRAYPFSNTHNLNLPPWKSLLDCKVQWRLGGRLWFITRGVCHTVALPFTLKSILSQKNYGNSNISSCKMIILIKNL